MYPNSHAVHVAHQLNDQVVGHGFSWVFTNHPHTSWSLLLLRLPHPHMCTYYSAILGSSADFLCTLQKPFYIILDFNHLSIHFLFFSFLNYFCHKFSACMYVHIHKENAKYLLYLGSVFRLNQMILFHGFMFRLGWMNFWMYMPYSHYNDIKNISFI